MIGIDMYFVVKVWPRTVAGRADVADDLSCSHGLSDADLRLSDHVTVAGEDAALMLYVNVPAAAFDPNWIAVVVAAPITVVGCIDGVAAYAFDGSGGRGVDWGVTGGEEINAIVTWPVGGAESGTDRGVYGLGPGACGAGGELFRR